MSKKKQEETTKPDAKEIEEEYEEHLIELARKENEEKSKEEVIVELKDIPGLGKKTLDILTENDITTVDKLMTTRLIELQEMGVQRAVAKNEVMRLASVV